MKSKQSLQFRNLDLNSILTILQYSSNISIWDVIEMVNFISSSDCGRLFHTEHMLSPQSFSLQLYLISILV